VFGAAVMRPICPDEQSGRETETVVWGSRRWDAFDVKTAGGVNGHTHTHTNKPNCPDTSTLSVSHQQIFLLSLCFSVCILLDHHLSMLLVRNVLSQHSSKLICICKYKHRAANFWV